MTIPASLKTIERYDNTYKGAFYQSKITNLVISEGMERVPDLLVSGVQTVKTISIPNSVTEIGNWAFNENALAGTLELPSGITKIGNNAFRLNKSLKTLVLPNTVTEIEYSAFDKNDGLTVIIPESVTNIGETIFSNAISACKIKGYYESEAYRYAKANKYTFVSMNEAITSVGVSLSLKSPIGLVYTLSDVSDAIYDEKSVVEIQSGSKTDRMALTDFERAEDGTVKICKNVPIKEFDQDVELKIWGPDGMLIAFTAGGGTGTEGPTSCSYSVQKYINKNKTSTNANLKKLVLALENYAGYTKAYFNDEEYAGVDTLATKMNQVDSSSVADFKAVYTGSCSSLKYVGSSLILKTGTKIRNYFQVTNPDALERYIFSVTMDGGETKVISPICKSGNIYYIEIDNISPADLDIEFHIELSNQYDEEDRMSIDYSALSYANSVLKKGDDASLVNLVKALYLYNEAANAYFQ